MNNLPKRKNNRLLGFNYSNSASYFITICTANRRKLFWTDKLDGTLSDQGIAAEQELLALPKRFMLTGIDKYVIMPDHIHLIITLIGAMPGTDEKTPDVKNVIGSFKAKVTGRIGNGNTVWQKSFYDHVIRNNKEYSDIWEYIEFNPCKYLESGKYKEFPIQTKKSDDTNGRSCPPLQSKPEVKQ